MSERIDRLTNIHIEDYAREDKELPIYAMLRLYLNCVEEPMGRIAGAKGTADALVELLGNAAANAMSETSDYAGDRGPLNAFFSNLDCEEVARNNGELIRRFLEDCEMELVQSSLTGIVKGYYES